LRGTTTKAIVVDVVQTLEHDEDRFSALLMVRPKRVGSLTTESERSGDL